MSTHQTMTCDCGAPNSALAFRCCECGKLFDGAQGNTLSLSRRVTVFPTPSHSNPSQGPHALQPAPSLNPARSFSISRHRTEVKVAIVTFSANALERQAPAPPDEVGPFTLAPATSTNEADGIKMAGDIWKRSMPNAHLNLILLGDGEPTAGGGLFGDDKKAALEEAQILKNQGARIVTIGVKGPTMDFDHLRSLASAPALAFEAQSGTIARVFVNATHSITTNRWGQTGAELVIFVIDESGSMGEENKKTEAEEAVRRSVELLRNA